MKGGLGSTLEYIHQFLNDGGADEWMFYPRYMAVNANELQPPCLPLPNNSDFRLKPATKCNLPRFRAVHGFNQQDAAMTATEFPISVSWAPDHLYAAG